jgi:hypothetical protein
MASSAAADSPILHGVFQPAVAILSRELIKRPFTEPAQSDCALHVDMRLPLLN